MNSPLDFLRFKSLSIEEESTYNQNKHNHLIEKSEEILSVDHFQAYLAVFNIPSDGVYPESKTFRAQGEVDLHDTVQDTPSIGSHWDTSCCV